MANLAFSNCPFARSHLGDSGSRKCSGRKQATMMAMSHSRASMSGKSDVSRPRTIVPMHQKSSP